MEPQRPPEDQRLTDGERKVLLFLVACFVLGSLSLALKSLRGERPALRGMPGAAGESGFSNPGTRSPEAARVPAGKGPDSPAEPRKKPGPQTKVNLNSAGAAELETLPGIGPALALRIVQDRAERGPYHSLDELGRVKGVGLKLLEKLRGKVTVGGKE